MAKYVSRPIEIEAVRLTEDNVVRCSEWCNGQIIEFTVAPPEVSIDTLEGRMRAKMGDYIVCGTDGEFYPVKPHIFEHKYNVVEGDHPDRPPWQATIAESIRMHVEAGCDAKGLSNVCCHDPQCPEWTYPNVCRHFHRTVGGRINA